jgi:hypothetical protein
MLKMDQLERIWKLVLVEGPVTLNLPPGLERMRRRSVGLATSGSPAPATTSPLGPTGSASGGTALGVFLSYAHTLGSRDCQEANAPIERQSPN